MADFEHALTLSPESLWILEAKADALADLDRLDEALEVHAGIIALNEELAYSWLARGDLYQRMRLYTEAIDDYSRALEAEPEYVRAYSRRGEAYA